MDEKTCSFILYTDYASGLHNLVRYDIRTALCAPHRLAILKNATFIVTDDEDLALESLLTEKERPVILITPDEFNHATGVPTMVSAHKEVFCPIHPGDVAQHLSGVIKSMVEDHFSRGTKAVPAGKRSA